MPIILFGMLLCLPGCWFLEKGSEVKVATINDVIHLFPTTVDGINKRLETIVGNVKNEVAEIIAIPDEKRSFKNTYAALDKAVNEFGQEGGIFHTIVAVSPDAALRDAANKAIITLQEISVDVISQNRQLYQALKKYAETKAPQENLNDEERYYVEETLKSFKRNGLDLPEQGLEEIKRIKKELGNLEQEFARAINDDTRKIMIPKEELEGIAPEFLAALKHTSDGRYELGTDYPTYHEVMDNCSVESTRKALWTAFVNRAYPVNEKTLNNIISLRDELAHKLGFASYAEYDIDDEMAKNPLNVEKFLDDIAVRSTPKALSEIERYKKNLPSGITLSEGKFKPWDLAHTKNLYRKKEYNYDDRVVAEYFPVESTFQGLLKLYENFLSVKFKQLPDVSPYGIPVKALQVNDKNGNLVGNLLLDLYPRPNKYTHACHITLVHGLKKTDGITNPSASIVLANFPQPSAERPALLQHHDVVTFFHEFGHAMHALLGRTEMYGFSGTNVKTDFVEMPSQMLEEWMWDRATIKTISKHYKIGEPLPDALINVMITLKNLDSGDFVKRQVMLGKISLDYFKNGRTKDTTAIMHTLQKTLRPYMAVIPEDHFQCSFGHLTNYASKYYAYLWSKVYACDLFEYIKEHGMDSKVGQRYVDCILSKGGSRPPQELIRDFLGREPNSNAFFKDLGF